MTEDERQQIISFLQQEIRELSRPLCFEALCAAEILEHVEGMRYRPLVPPGELPQEVRDRIVGIDQTVTNGVLTDVVLVFR